MTADPLAPVATYDEVYEDDDPDYVPAVDDPFLRDAESAGSVPDVPDRTEHAPPSGTRKTPLTCTVPDVPDVPDLRTPETEPPLGDAISHFVGRFVAFPSFHAAVAVVLWTIHTHLFDVFDSTPRLAVLSPEPGSGKSRLLEVLELLCRNPLHALNASTAAIFRIISKAPPTLLLDEVDTIFGRHGKDDDHEDLRGLLNAGHRQGATIPRCVGPTHQVEMFEVTCPVALAGLGDLPDTLMSRSVVIRMRRRAPDENVEPFRRRDELDTAQELHDRIAAWAEQHRDRLTVARPILPVEDRPADVWESLVAIADELGGTWPTRARDACTALSAAAMSRDASLGVKLLTDLRTVFGDRDRLTTEHTLTGLCELQESPWNDLRGKPLDARGLAGFLAQYGITSTKIRVGDESRRGYRREDLHDAWIRYCEPDPAAPPAGPEHPEQAEHPRSQARDLFRTDTRVPEQAEQNRSEGAP